MELDVSFDNESLSIPIKNPFRVDQDDVIEKITGFLSAKGINAENLDIRGLLPKMIKGIAGCESGCPANAKSLVSRGFDNFELSYIEGGILSAKTVAENGKELFLKMFPDF